MTWEDIDLPFGINGIDMHLIHWHQGNILVFTYQSTTEL